MAPAGAQGEVRYYLAETTQIGRGGAALIRQPFGLPPSPLGKALLRETTISLTNKI